VIFLNNSIEWFAHSAKIIKANEVHFSLHRHLLMISLVSSWNYLLFLDDGIIISQNTKNVKFFNTFFVLFYFISSKLALLIFIFQFKQKSRWISPRFLEFLYHLLLFILLICEDITTTIITEAMRIIAKVTKSPLPLPSKWKVDLIHMHIE